MIYSKLLSRLAPCLVLASVACSNSSSNDAGATDTGTGATDTGTAFNVANGCTQAMYTDLSSASATRSIAFGAGGSLTYTPKCATIAVGQTVIFSGTFSTHPLVPGVPPTQTGTSSANNPITNTTTGTSASFTFTAPGIYPYYCGVHASLGMVGAIQVM